MGRNRRRRRGSRYESRPVLTSTGLVRRFLQAGADLAELVPTKDDNVLQKGLKFISLIEELSKILSQEEADIYEEFIASQKLEAKRDRAFINIFFTTQVVDLFKEHTHILDEGGQHSMLEFSNPEFGSLFIKPDQVPEEPDEDDDGSVKAIRSEDVNKFWFKYGFDFNGVLEELWKIFDNKINIQMEKSRIKYSGISVSKDPFAGKSAKWVEAISDKHATYKKDGVPRAVLFVGPPGVGKSTLVLKVASNIGKRILRMEAGSIESLNPTSMVFLLGGLKPDCLIIDDVDRGSFREGLSTMFTVLDWMKLEYPQVPLLMTANRVSHLDSAFMRPGRVDEVLWFNMPSEEDRLVLLDTYLDFFGVSASSDDKEKIVKVTEGLAVPWIKEVALQLKYESVENVLKLIESMIALKGDLKYSYGSSKAEKYQEFTYVD